MKSKKVKVIFWGTFVLTLPSSAVFYKTMSRISFNFFRRGDKKLLSDFMRKWDWFYEHDVHFPKNIGSKLKFQKSETLLCRWKSNDCNDINIFLSLKNPSTFLLAKEKTRKCVCKTNCEFLQSTEKQFILSKTTVNRLFSDICYLVIVCFG